MTSPTPATRWFAAIACGAVLAAGATTAQAATESQRNTSATSGATWIRTQQDTATGTFNRGFSSFDSTATALASAGVNAADVSRGGSPTLQTALFTILSTPANASHPAEVGGYEQAMLSGYSAGIDTARISASENLVADLASTYTGGYFGDPTEPFVGFTNTAYGLLALNTRQAPGFLTAKTIDTIRQNQHTDGGWGADQAITSDAQAADSDVDVTAATLAALCGAGVGSSDAAVSRGVDFLRSDYRPTSGGFTSFGSANTNSTGTALAGLKACGIDPQGPGFNGTKTPVDYLIDRQGPSNGANNGSFEYSDPPNPFIADGPNLAASRDAVRGLGAAREFAPAPPVRATPALPRTRPVPAVPTGTVVPLSLAVDDGAGGVTFCRVSAPTGSSLAAVLATANTATTPSGCATGAQFTDGQLSRLNGQTGTWSINVDGAAEQTAASQTVGFGDLIALRRTAGATPAPTTPGGTGQGAPAATQPVPAATQAKTEAAAVASKSLGTSAKRRTVTVSVSCAKANRLCQGVAYVVYRKRTLGRRPFLIAGGRSTKLNVKLSKSGVKRVGKSKRVQVNLFSRDGNGIASTSSKTVTLKISG